MKPFKYGCVVTGEAFCPRPDLQRTLARHVKDGQNVVLVGERRMGKTSLVYATLADLRKWRMIYVDLLNVRTAADVCNRVATAAARLGGASSLPRKALRFLSRLRPTFSLDPMSGMPVVSVDAKAAEDPQSLSDVVDMVGKMAAGENVFVVLDEFQEIRKISGADQILAILRSRIQLLADTCFVFSGSVRDDIADIFSNPASPFFKSALTLTVGPVPDDDFAPFLVKRFATGKRKADRAFVDRIFDFTNRTTGDVQQLCSAVWNVTEPGDVLGEAELGRALSDVFAEESGAFEAQTSKLTRFQFKTLVAVARHGGRKVFSADFLSAAELPSAASASRAFKSLVAAGLLFHNQGEYRFFNPFLRAWLIDKGY